jgi:CRISPR/Cas system-associated protein Cas10 (large subunit of type III CRISPR-Cas system)
LGDFLEKSSQETPLNEEEQKKLFPYHENEGGPIENYDEDAKSAEWMSELESDSFSIDIRTEDIKEHFPE